MKSRYFNSTGKSSSLNTYAHTWGKHRRNVRHANVVWITQQHEGKETRGNWTEKTVNEHHMR